jgi:hypothetical protein
VMKQNPKNLRSYLRPPSASSSHAADLATN